MPTARDLLMVNGDLFVGQFDLALVYDAAAIEQQCGITLAMFLGEVFFDTTAGTNWLALLGSKTATNGDFAAEVRRALLTVPGVTSVQNIVVTRDAARVGQISAQVTTDTGALLTIQKAV